MNVKVINDYDLKDFISSLDKAIKIRVAKESIYKPENIPKITLGSDKAFQENENQSVYERPFIEIYVSRRAPSSLSDKDFFSGMTQHAPYFSEETPDGKIYKRLYRDNELKLILRTKTKGELYNLVQMFERLIIYESKLFKHTAVLMRYIGFKDKTELVYSLYEGEITLRVRTSVVIEEEDNSVLNNVNITYQDSLCDYFDLVDCKCSFEKHFGVPAEKSHLANDISCYRKNFCKNYITNEKLSVTT